MKDDEGYYDPEDISDDDDDYAFEAWLEDVQNMEWDKIKDILDDDITDQPPYLSEYDSILFSIDKSSVGGKDHQADVPEDSDMIDIFRSLIITAYGQHFSDEMDDHQIMGLLEKISHITGIDKEDIIIAIQEGSAGIDQVFNSGSDLHPSLSLRDSVKRDRNADDFIGSVKGYHKSSKSPGSTSTHLVEEDDVVDDVLDDVLDDEASQESRIEQLRTLDNMLRAEHDTLQVARITYLRQLILRED